MEWLLDPTLWLGFFTLVLLELILGIDNLVFIAILAQKLPPKQRNRACKIGLSMALGIRFVLLFFISSLATFTDPIITFFETTFSGRDLIMLVGGAFLIYKATVEIHGRLEGKGHADSKKNFTAKFWMVIIQIIVLDAVFSLDAVITAIGMTDHLSMMIFAVSAAMFLMIAVSEPLARFVNEHPTVVMLCLGFLLMVGFSLIAEGFSVHIPKGYLYAAIGFSIVIEGFNQFAQARLKRRLGEPSDLRQRTADAVLRVLGASQSSEENQDTHEIGTLLHHASKTDLLSPFEKDLLRGVLNLSERPINTIMTPRTDIEWLDISKDEEDIRRQIVESTRSQLLVGREEIDTPLGIIHREDLLPSLVKENHLPTLTKIMKEPLFIHEQISILRSLEMIKGKRADMAIILDEFGVLQGLITHHDLLEAIAGEFPEQGDPKNASEISRQNDGSYIIDGKTSIYEVCDITGLDYQPDGNFATIAGFILHEFARIPNLNEELNWGDWHIKILELDGKRIGKLMFFRNLE